MYCMFNSAHVLNGDLSRWDTSNVTTMMSMFWDAHAFNGDLSRWDTSNVTTMAYMFCCTRAFNFACHFLPCCNINDSGVACVWFQ